MASRDRSLGGKRTRWAIHLAGLIGFSLSGRAYAKTVCLPPTCVNKIALVAGSDLAAYERKYLSIWDAVSQVG
jgi:hypothetical protein